MKNRSACRPGAGAQRTVHTAGGLAKSYGQHLRGCNARNMRANRIFHKLGEGTPIRLGCWFGGAADSRPERGWTGSEGNAQGELDHTRWISLCNFTE